MPFSRCIPVDGFNKASTSKNLNFNNPSFSLYASSSLVVLLLSLVPTVYIAPYATLNWALCVSPGPVRAGSLVSMKGSSYSAKRQLWWGFFFSPGSRSLSVQCNCHSAAPNLGPWSLPKLDRQEHKRWKYWALLHLSIHTSVTPVHFSWDRIDLQKHLPCLPSGSDWLNNQANKNPRPLLLRVSEETRMGSPWNVQYFCSWWWSYTGTHLWKRIHVT